MTTTTPIMAYCFHDETSTSSSAEEIGLKGCYKDGDTCEMHQYRLHRARVCVRGGGGTVNFACLSLPALVHQLVKLFRLALPEAGGPRLSELGWQSGWVPRCARDCRVRRHVTEWSAMPPHAGRQTVGKQQQIE